MENNIKVGNYELSTYIEIPNDITIMELSKILKDDEIINLIPVTKLSENYEATRIIEKGKYYTQRSEENFSLSVRKSDNCYAISSTCVYDNYIHRKYLIYNKDTHGIKFEWNANSLDKSTHYTKLYKNENFLNVKNQELTKEELKKGIDDLFIEINNFEGINQLINLEEFKENISKYIREGRS